MKKLFFVIPVVLLFAAIFSSCNKKSADGEKFSTLSVEDNKAIVETAGVDLVQVMGRMKSIETIDVIANLGDIMSSSGSKGFLFSKDSKLFSTLRTFAAAAKGDKKLNDVFDALASSKGLSEDPESIQEFWDNNVGTYTWNPDLNDFDVVSGGSKFIFLFPSSDVAVSNDATLTVHSYTGVNISNPLDEDYTGDLPTALNADLKVGSDTLITFTFAASYNTDGVPNAIAADLMIESFKFEIDITNTETVVSVNYKFLENDIVVLDLGASGKGLFTEANYNDNTTTHTETNGYYDWVYNTNTQQYEEVWVEYTEEWKETDFEEILNSASAHFQLFNVAIRGDINVKGLVDQIRLIDADRENEVITNATADSLRAIQINKFLNLRLVNVTTNQIMAKAEAYVVKEIQLQYTDTYIDFKLTFGDGSPIDMETYFNSGFDSFISELNGLIDDINSEYDLGIDPVDY
jgi:hypothetical protein